MVKSAFPRLEVDPFIGTGFGFTEKFHRNFYHNFMEDFELEADRDNLSPAKPQSNV